MLSQTSAEALLFAGLLPPLRAIAREAGQVIVRIYHEAYQTRTKTDGSPVTVADTAAENIILPALRQLTPDFAIISEEEYAAGVRPESLGELFWLVDPLDGTKEFIKRNGEFTVNIALIEKGVPVAGVVYAPALGDLYAGAGPGTALHWREGERDRPLAVRTPPAAGITAVASRSHGENDQTEAFLARFPVAERAARGSSLKFCLIAAGEADLYPRFGPTCEWDTAAGHAVLLAAGGRVETVDGAPLRYGKTDFRNPFFIAWGKL